jgi:hypothetical protein
MKTININGKEYTEIELISELNILNHKLGNLQTLLTKDDTTFTLSNSNNATVIEMSLYAISGKIEYEIEATEEEINNLESHLEAL